MTPRWPCMLLVACLASSGLDASAQSQQQQGYQQNPNSTVHGPEPDLAGERMRATQARAREMDLHQKMISDTNHLVLLCKQLEDNLKAHPVPNAEDLRALQEIEKLARGVKDRMRE